MTARISRDDYGLLLAQAAAGRADCTRRQVGAVIVSADGDIVATGYNGAPAGEPGCLSDGACPRGRLTYAEAPPGQGYEETRCIALHAELNAVVRAGRDRCKGSTIYVTDEPCYLCSLTIKAAGIARVVVPEDRRTVSIEEAAEVLDIPLLRCNCPETDPAERVAKYTVLRMDLEPHSIMCPRWGLVAAK